MVRRILGLDPGLQNTGWGIIDMQGSRLSYVACGRICPDVKADMAIRLHTLFNRIHEVIEDFGPTESAVEETFLNKNPKTTLILGQARGVVLAAPAALGLPVAEYAANRVKKSVVGVGHADKTQVKTMVQHLLPTAQIDSPDAADALAVAICHGHFSKVLVGGVKTEQQVYDHLPLKNNYAR